MGSYASVAKKVFGAAHVSQGTRIRLFCLLVVSRLLYNVHVWSSLSRKSYASINTGYIRGLRRISGECKYSPTSTDMTDHAVRAHLGAPSLQCLIMQRRLSLFGAILQYGPSCLHTLLSAARGDRILPWVALLRRDLIQLQQFWAPKLDELGAVTECSARWAQFVCNHASEWKELVNGFVISTMGLDQPSAHPGFNLRSAP